MEDPPLEFIPAGLSKSRIEALTDGIFAIAMTLLVLGIEVPQIPPLPPVNVLLSTLIPDIIHYVISFFALAVLWVLHHQQFHHLKVVDHLMLWLNITWLLLIALIPFTTSLADTYTGNQFSNIPFAINLLLVSLLLFGQWQHVRKNREIFTPDIPERVMILERNRSLVVLVITFAGSILAFISLFEGIVVYLLIPVTFAIYPRITGRMRRVQMNKRQNP